MAEENQIEEKLPSETETIKEFQEIIKKLEKEKEEYLEGWKRAKADLLNYQKEMENKMKEIIVYANENLLIDLIPVLDSLDLALNSLSEEDKNTSLGKGYYLIQAQLLEILAKHGLEVISPENKKFDPVFHEAVATQKCSKENCDKSDDNLIVEVLAKGYLLNGKLIRPAKVKVLIH
jgi:molecular chaperone GrpE